MTNLSKTDTTAPALADLITQPTCFFTALRSLPPSPARYLWVVALTGLIGGIAATILGRNALAAQSTLLSGATGGPSISPLFLYGSTVFAGLFLTAIIWLILWGLGALGAGPSGRAAEVAGATFLPSLIFSVVLLPIGALFAPELNVPAPNLSGLSGAALTKAIQTYSTQVQAASAGQPVNTITTYLGYAMYVWQAVLAFTGFQVLTGDAGKAWRGILIPVAVFVVLGVAGVLISRSLASLTGSS
jgi:hypothetical protein